MASKPRLSLLRAKTLQHIAFLTGLPSSGTKQRLADYLAVELQRPRLSRHGSRIVSVDMGIRNLAYCVLDTPGLDSPKDKIYVQEWKRLDVLRRMISRSPSSSENNSTGSAALDEQRDTPKADFSPSVMAAAAVDITRDLLSHQPTTILIERQRFRSGGGSAIQEWTVRVNMLESMLWACLETTRRSRSIDANQSFPASYEVSPARVAAFWTAGQDDLLRPSPGLLRGEESGMPEPQKRVRGVKKSGKSDKIAVVRSWLAGEGGVALDFSADAQMKADAFMSTSRLKKRRKIDSNDADGDGTPEHVRPSLSKRDDLADCMLQGVAWYRWEQNCREIAAILLAT